MIKPGQKLKEGDYCKVNSEQADILWFYEYGRGLSVKNDSVIKFDSIDDGLSLKHKNFIGETEYEFADFKQLCENTFGK